MIFVAIGSPPGLPIRRNTVILSATMAVNSAVLQLTAAVSSLTFVLVTGVRGLLGLGPAIFLTSSGLTAVPAGRLMDRVGRIPVMKADALTVPWLAAGGLALVALVLVQFVRPDPKRIAELLGASDDVPTEPAAPLRELVRRPGVRPAMLAALASFGVMVSVMNLSGYVVVEHHHHNQDSVFPIIGAHVFGMYALVLVIGALIDRVGRAPALQIGLVVMAISTIGLLWVASGWATAVLLLGLGLGWNFSFVAATAQLADRTSPAERGKLLGFNDLLGALFGASLALLGGYALDAIGVGALAIGATVIVATPVLLIARTTTAPPPAREPA